MSDAILTLLTQSGSEFDDPRAHRSVAHMRSIARRPAGGNLAADINARAASDGYMVMTGTIRTHAVNYSRYSKLPYHPVRDLTSIALAGENPNALDVYPRVAANTMKELIAPTWRGPVY